MFVERALKKKAAIVILSNGYILKYKWRLVSRTDHFFCIGFAYCVNISIECNVYSVLLSSGQNTHDYSDITIIIRCGAHALCV